jgi:hypothetical protein
VASRAQGLPAGRQGTAQVERLAHHALRGEVWAKILSCGVNLLKHASQSPLPASPRLVRRTRYAPASYPLPPRPRPPVSQDRPIGAGPC